MTVQCSLFTVHCSLFLPDKLLCNFQGSVWITHPAPYVAKLHKVLKKFHLPASFTINTNVLLQKANHQWAKPNFFMSVFLTAVEVQFTWLTHY